MKQLSLARTHVSSPTTTSNIAALGRESQVPTASGPKPSGSRRGAYSFVSKGEGEGHTGQERLDELSHIVHHNHSKVSSSSSSYSSLLKQEELPVPCKAGAVEPSMVAQVPELEEQRNIFQSVISFIRWENGPFSLAGVIRGIPLHSEPLFHRSQIS